MKLKALLVALAIPAVLLAATPVPAHAFDLFPNSVCKFKTTTTNQSSPVCAQAAAQGTKNPVVDIIRTATNVMSLLAGVLGVIMIIIAGFSFVTSAGNSEATGNARKRITNTIIGLVIVALAWTIIRLVTDRIIQ